uniref:Uncharacterized protein n=1 Tax=Glossina palpalis gambiensis TaxID=67801 RepID=A0A1B0AY22_9MUSC
MHPAYADLKNNCLVNIEVIEVDFCTLSRLHLKSYTQLKSAKENMGENKILLNAHIAFEAAIDAEHNINFYYEGKAVTTCLSKSESITLKSSIGNTTTAFKPTPDFLLTFLRRLCADSVSVISCCLLIRPPTIALEPHTYTETPVELLIGYKYIS